jgi:RNA polymerase sigma factor for flagellar operon FliA
MPERSQLEALFLAHLPFVERILGAQARRHGVTGDDAEEFAAWAKMRLVENDYAILVRFRGESSLSTYLTVVLATLQREYRVAEWGRWRSSTAARRAGPVAVRLETLTQRDGMTLGQAAELLRTTGETTLSDRELGALAMRFPMRAPLRPVKVGDARADAPGSTRADDLIENDHAASECIAARRALDDALGRLPDEDRLVVRLHYMEAMSVADIARGLALPQKPLYKRLDRALRQLRRELERAGVTREYVQTLVARGT